MTEELATALDADGTVLVTTSSDRVGALNIDVLESFNDGQGFNCVYVSASRPHTTVERALSAHGIGTDRFFFIDMASPESVEEHDNAVFVNPRSLTSLSIAITTAVKSMPSDAPTLVLVDTLDTMMLYNRDEIVTRFTHSVLSKLHELDSACVVLASMDGSHEGSIRGMRQFFDRTVSL